MYKHYEYCVNWAQRWKWLVLFGDIMNNWTVWKTRTSAQTKLENFSIRRYIWGQRFNNNNNNMLVLFPTIIRIIECQTLFYGNLIWWSYVTKIIVILFISRKKRHEEVCQIISTIKVWIRREQDTWEQWGLRSLERKSNQIPFWFWISLIQTSNICRLCFLNSYLETPEELIENVPQWTWESVVVMLWLLSPNVIMTWMKSVTVELKRMESKTYKR